MEVEKPGGEVRRHCFDFHDQRKAKDRDALEWCDIYWKSNFHPANVASYRENLKAKVRPYGWYFPVRSRNERLLPWRLLGSAYAKNSWARRKRQGSRLRRTYSLLVRHPRSYKARLYIDEYESRSVVRNIGAYFHPGCWPMIGGAQEQANHKGVRSLDGYERAWGSSL
jgi:hypothetical protein